MICRPVRGNVSDSPSMIHHHQPTTPSRRSFHSRLRYELLLLDEVYLLKFAVLMDDL